MKLYSIIIYEELVEFFRVFFNNSSLDLWLKLFRSINLLCQYTVFIFVLFIFCMKNSLAWNTFAMENNEKSNQLFSLCLAKRQWRYYVISVHLNTRCISVIAQRWHSNEAYFFPFICVWAICRVHETDINITSANEITFFSPILVIIASFFTWESLFVCCSWHAFIQSIWRSLKDLVHEGRWRW